MKTSIIIPFYNEEMNVESVLEETHRLNPEAEIIAVNDGSTDRTELLIAKYSQIRLISFSKHLGQSAAIYSGLTQAQGDVCVLMDGDGQSDPADIPKLISWLENADLVCGYRQDRQDTWLRCHASTFANFLRRKILCDNVRDTGCALKVMRRVNVRHLIPFDGLHRYLPVLFNNAGLRIVEITVNHRARKFGTTKYTIGRRAFLGVFDLIGVRWLMSRRIDWPKVE